MSKFPDETMTLNGPEGWTIELDRRELEKEPGEAEPSLIFSRDGKLKGSYDAAFSYEEVQGVALSEEVARWVESVADDVHSFLYG